jgi:rubrerythrin
MDERLRSLLSRIINAELHAIVLYLQSSFNLKGMEMLTAAETFEEYAKSEMGHLGIWSKFWTANGGVLQYPNLVVPAPTTLREAATLAFKAEEDGIKLYVEGRQLGEEINYTAFTIMCENILAEEEDHRQVFLKMLAGLPEEEVDTPAVWGNKMVDAV